MCVLCSAFLSDLANEIDIIKMSPTLSAEYLPVLDDCSHIVAAVIERVRACDSSNFVSVIGMKCTFSLAISVLTTLFAVVSFFLSASNTT